MPDGMAVSMAVMRDMSGDVVQSRANPSHFTRSAALDQTAAPGRQATAMDCGSLLPPSSRSLLRWQKTPLHPELPNHRIADQSRPRNSRVIHASRAGSAKRQQGCRSPCGEACRAGSTHLHDRGFRTMATSRMPPPLRHCHDTCHLIQRALGVTVAAHLPCRGICRSRHKTDKIRGDLRGLLCPFLHPDPVFHSGNPLWFGHLCERFLPRHPAL